MATEASNAVGVSLPPDDDNNNKNDKTNNDADTGMCGVANPDAFCNSIPNFSLAPNSSNTVLSQVSSDGEGGRGEEVAGNKGNENAEDFSQVTSIVTENGYKTETIESSVDKVESKLNIVGLETSREDETERALNEDLTTVKLVVDDSLAANLYDEAGSCVYMDGYWVCNPYECEVLEHQLKKYPQGDERRCTIIKTLQDLGVKVFVIDGRKTEGLSDIMKHVRKITIFVARENAEQPYMGPVGYLRCLLYQDDKGHLFNMVLP